MPVQLVQQLSAHLGGVSEACSSGPKPSSLLHAKKGATNKESSKLAPTLQLEIGSPDQADHSPPELPPRKLFPSPEMMAAETTSVDVINISSDDDEDVQILEDSMEVVVDAGVGNNHKRGLAASSAYAKHAHGLQTDAVEMVSLLSEDKLCQPAGRSAPNTGMGEAAAVASKPASTGGTVAGEPAHDGVLPVGAQQPGSAAATAAAGSAFSTPCAPSGPGINRRVYQLSTLVGRVAKRGRNSLWAKLSATARALQFSPVEAAQSPPAGHGAADGDADAPAMEVETPPATIAMRALHEDDIGMGHLAAHSIERDDVAMADEELAGTSSEGIQAEQPNEYSQQVADTDGDWEQHRDCGHGVEKHGAQDQDMTDTEGADGDADIEKEPSSQQHATTSSGEATSDATDSGGGTDSGVSTEQQTSSLDQDVDLLAVEPQIGRITARSVAAYAAMKAGMWCVGLGAAWLAYVYATPEDW